jgi:transcriptional antiterminator RfaH
MREIEREFMAGQPPAWFCVRTQAKHEHIAAAHLRSAVAVEVYLPRIRFKRATRRGPVWFTEALFPSYLFAHFDLLADLRPVTHARGVCGVVHFHDRWPIVPDAVVDELRRALGAEPVHVIDEAPCPGEAVDIAGGVFQGLRAVVIRVLPCQERVAVLLEFLGRQTSVELAAADVVGPGAARQRILQS